MSYLSPSYSRQVEARITIITDHHVAHHHRQDLACMTGAEVDTMTLATGEAAQLVGETEAELADPIADHLLTDATEAAVMEDQTGSPTLAAITTLPHPVMGQALVGEPIPGRREWIPPVVLTILRVM